MTTLHLTSKWAPVRRMGLFAVDLAMAWAAGLVLANALFWVLVERIDRAYLWSDGCCGSAFLGGLAQFLISLAYLALWVVGAALWCWLGRPRVHRVFGRVLNALKTNPR